MSLFNVSKEGEATVIRCRGWVGVDEEGLEEVRWTPDVDQDALGGMMHLELSPAMKNILREMLGAPIGAPDSMDSVDVLSNGSILLKSSNAGAQLLAEHFIDVLSTSGAPNYIEFLFTNPTGAVVSVLVRHHEPASKTPHELRIEAERANELASRELVYTRKRIDDLVGKLDAVDLELLGTPALDPKDRYHEQWSLGLAPARRMREERDALQRQVTELQTQVEHWKGEAHDWETVAKQIFEEPAKPTDRSVVVRGDWMQTASGRVFWPLAPQARDIDLDDIAHALANTCRFSGHVREFYSVAQHCVLASLNVPEKDAAWALLHDAAEAYISDLVRPIKHSPGGLWFRQMEDRIMRCVCDRFNLSLDQPQSVSEADLVMLGTERRDLMSEPPRPWRWCGEPLEEKIVPWNPVAAKRAFLDRAKELGIE